MIHLIYSNGERIEPPAAPAPVKAVSPAWKPYALSLNLDPVRAGPSPSWPAARHVLPDLQLDREQARAVRAGVPLTIRVEP
ncbi:hypothetical protein [Duganella callida]|uniref:Uncharacterized protein n=1 Tax=Duganella callida TaxID=2561932 RepID=A0A4Y9SUY5_9BURK|nr:hypothetical protein [Duganella callida]TFW28463.1 hypothetical protein E4L98_05595 [Duganella callida]